MHALTQIFTVFEVRIDSTLCKILSSALAPHAQGLHPVSVHVLVVGAKKPEMSKMLLKLI